MAFDATCNLLKHRFGAESITISEFRDNRRIHVAPQQAFEILRCLKEEAGFDQLAELGGADYLHYPGARDRFGVWYVLVNIATGERGDSSRVAVCIQKAIRLKENRCPELNFPRPAVVDVVNR